MRNLTLGELIIGAVATGLISVAVVAYAAHGGGGAGGNGQFRGGSGLHGGGPQYKEIPATYNHRADLNTQMAGNPGGDHGTWNESAQGRWYDGYWHQYWNDKNWEWYNGFYGFWLGDVFVSELEPGVCQYWDGSTWQAWYNPPDTPYYCPY